MVLPKNIAEVISGAWVLLNNTTTDLKGVPVTDEPPLGSKPVGLLTYHSTGFMSANLASTNPEHRPMDLTYPFKPNQSDAEWAIVGKRTLAYAGNLSVTEDSTPLSGQLIHGPLSVSNVPSWTGTNQLRNYTVYPGKGKAKTVIHLFIRDEPHNVIGHLYWEKQGEEHHGW